MGNDAGVLWEWYDAGRSLGMDDAGVLWEWWYDAGVFWEWGMTRAFSGNGMMRGVFYYCLILSDINN